MSILTAFGLTQFNAFLPDDHIVPHDLVVSHLEPFAARLDIEVITAPRPVIANRSALVSPMGLSMASSEAVYEQGGAETQYIHFILNQRTIPLGRSFEACGPRDDGWCELETFLKVQQKEALKKADYEFACFGDYDVPEYGDVWDGAPVRF